MLRGLFLKVVYLLYCTRLRDYILYYQGIIYFWKDAVVLWYTLYPGGTLYYIRKIKRYYVQARVYLITDKNMVFYVVIYLSIHYTQVLRT